jgi:signal transduction histidine kinase/ligand-binding sensor domain-containing protein
MAKPDVIRNSFLILFIIHGFFTSSQGQVNQIRFEHITIHDGLSLSSVYCIHQDKKGFMWFGTEDGLNKYDGKEFIIYRPVLNDTSSIVSKWIEQIYEDEEGNLWFGSKEGLTRFDPRKERFRQFATTHDNLIGDTITYMAETEDFIWMGAQSGLATFSKMHDSISQSFLTGQSIRSIVHRTNNQAIAIASNGMYLINATKQEMKMLQSGNSIEMASESKGKNSHWISVNEHVYRLYANDSISDCYLCTNHQHGDIGYIEKLLYHNNSVFCSASNGLFQYSIESDQLNRLIYAEDISHSLSVNTAKPLIADDEGAVWYGTFGNGIFQIKPDGTVYHYRHQNGDKTSLSEDAINCIFKDRSGKVWFGTFGAGINIYNPAAHKFRLMTHNPMIPNSLSSDFIWTIWEDRNKKLWIGTNDAGLNYFDPQTNDITVFLPGPSQPGSIGHSSIRKVMEDQKGRIWVGTDGAGLNLYDRQSNTFIHFDHQPNDPGSISSNSVRAIYEDSNGYIWVGTRQGLNKLDVESGVFQRFLFDKDNPQSLSNNFVYSAILEDHEGYLWVGAYGGGLNRLDPNDQTFTSYQYNPNDVNSISNNIIFAIIEKEKGILWVGTNHGLNRFDTKTKKFTRFTEKDGLPNAVIYGIMPDQQGNLWLTTNNGLAKFNMETHHVQNFKASDGLQSNEFNGGAFHSGQSGLMYAGGVYGLNIIDPTRSYSSKNTTEMVITGFELLGKKVQPETKSDIGLSEKVVERNGKYYIPNSIAYTDNIRLSYQQRYFTIGFATLNQTDPTNETNYYRMTGLDDNWRPAGSRTYVTYANMPPGKYCFELKTVNMEGLESLHNDQLKITIPLPYWRQWWFFALELAVTILIVGFIYRYQLNRRTNKILAEQNAIISRANEKLQKSEKDLKALVSTKDKFFSIISHDLKNPFTSLLSISELMAQDYESLDEEDKEMGVKRVNIAAKRIYQLLENLLTWSRAQSGRIKFDPLCFHMNNLIEENVLLHQEQAKKKGVKLQMSELPEARVFGDRDMINTVIRNLISNAIKFTPTNKKVEVSMEDDGSHWSIHVTDEGIGMNEEETSRLFKVGEKFKKEGTEGEKGTGLGLIICKEFVEKNNGQIFIFSSENEGSTFTFTVPKAGDDEFDTDGD